LNLKQLDLNIRPKSNAILINGNRNLTQLKLQSNTKLDLTPWSAKSGLN
jgi:hypothetical protein